MNISADQLFLFKTLSVRDSILKALLLQTNS